MFAYALFGESYLHAFAYIIAPSSGTMPGSKYPSNKRRVTILVDIASKEGIKLPDASCLGFADDIPRMPPRERFILRIAEDSVEGIVTGLWETVSAVLAKATVPRPTRGFSEKHVQRFELGIPASDPQCLGDIINAGWIRWKQLQMESEKPNEKNNGKKEKGLLEQVDDLNEILLKTIEVLEFSHRTKNGS
jgi:hypothetical protein